MMIIIIIVSAVGRMNYISLFPWIKLSYQFMIYRNWESVMGFALLFKLIDLYTFESIVTIVYVVMHPIHETNIIFKKWRT